jgi:septum site-determining protein MinD
MDKMGAKTVGVISIKGGVGKTSTVSSLGASLANDFKKKVLLVDANFTSPTLGLHIGLVNPEITLHHVLDGKANIKEAIYETGYGFDIIPGSHIYDRIDPYALKDKLKELKNNYDLIIVDSSPNLNEEILAAMMASDELLVLTTPDYVTLATTLNAVKLAKVRKTPIIGLVLNKVHGKDFELSIEDIEKAAGVNVLAVLPHEIKVLEALSKSTPSTLHKNSEMSLELKKLAGSLIGESYSEGKWKAFFKKLNNFGRVSKQEVNRVLLTGERLASPI